MKKYYPLLLCFVTTFCALKADQGSEKSNPLAPTEKTKPKGVDPLRFWSAIGGTFTITTLGSIIGITIYLKTGWRAEFYGNPKNASWEEKHNINIDQEDIPTINNKINLGFKNIKNSHFNDEQTTENKAITNLIMDGDIRWDPPKKILKKSKTPSKTNTHAENTMDLLGLDDV